MAFKDKILDKRKEKGLTQSQVGDEVGVSFQTVSLWENGKAVPQMDKMEKLAKLYDVSLAWLLEKESVDSVRSVFQDTLMDRLFDETKMYTHVQSVATTKKLYQSCRVLPYARNLHKGQTRKGKDKVPYIYHPLMVACHALALGLDNDDLISTALLHDVCEDCGVSVDELNVNEATKEAISLLTKPKGMDNDIYYNEISKNSIATMVKVLDRCNNISGMAAGFTKEKMVKYIRETETYIYPLLDKAKTQYPEYNNQIFVIKYHIKSVVEAIKRQY